MVSESHQPMSFSANDELYVAVNIALQRLASKWRGAIERSNHDFANRVRVAYECLRNFLLARDLTTVLLQDNDQPPTLSDGSINENPLFIVGEIALGRLAGRWRYEKSHEHIDRVNQISQVYRELFEYLWLHGFRGDMFPDAELPEDLMPSCYIDYWRSKGSL